MSHYPTIEELRQKPGSETILLTVYRSYRSSLSYIITSVIAALIVVGVINAFPEYRNELRWLGVIPMLMALNVVRKYYNDMIHFEQSKITQYYGRLSLNYEVPSLKYLDIRAIMVEQDIIGRILNYGNIYLGSSGGSSHADGYEMTLHGVLAPQELAILIAQFRTSIFDQQVTESGSSENRNRVQLLTGTLMTE